MLDPKTTLTSVIKLIRAGRLQYDSSVDDEAIAQALEQYEKTIRDDTLRHAAATCLALQSDSHTDLKTIQMANHTLQVAANALLAKVGK